MRKPNFLIKCHHYKRFYLKSLFTAGLSVLGLAIAQSATAADSAKLLWSGNGHYYQLFDRSATWAVAKSACESRGAHLATITSAEEQTFISGQLLSGYNSYSFHLGASDDATQYVWKWITGERFNYSNWRSGSPNNYTSEDYLTIAGGDGKWDDGYSYNPQRGYICEWSGHNYISTALVPDLNDNGIDEVATLYVNYQTGKHTVEIKDPLTDKAVSTLTFATSFASQPVGMAVIDDTNGNGKPDIAVLYTRYNLPHVTIKDVMNNKTVLREIDFLTSAYRPKTIGIGRDKNGNGANELVVIGIHKQTLKAMAEIRDSKSGLKFNNTPF
jgi:hypothetical protein